MLIDNSLPCFMHWKGSWQSHSHAASMRLIEANKKGILSAICLGEKENRVCAEHSGQNLLGEVTDRTLNEWAHVLRSPG